MVKMAIFRLCFKQYIEDGDCWAKALQPLISHKEWDRKGMQISHRGSIFCAATACKGHFGGAKQPI